MNKVIYDTSMSLDGFITGPDPRSGEPLGDGGDRLHEWMSGIADYRHHHPRSGDGDDVNASDAKAEGGRPRRAARSRPLKATTGIEPVYTALQAAA